MAAQPINLLLTVITYTFRVVPCQEPLWHSRALNYSGSMKLNITDLLTVWMGLSGYLSCRHAAYKALKKCSLTP